MADRPKGLNTDRLDRFTDPYLIPQPFPLLGRIEDVTMIVFVFDYLIRIATVHAVPQRLIYWDGRKVHERAVRPFCLLLSFPPKKNLLYATEQT